MTATLPRVPSWSERSISDACSWRYGNHEGSITLASMRKAAQGGCVRCKLLLDGIEKYNFAPNRPHRTTKATLGEYECDPALELEVSVFNNQTTPLWVVVHYIGMSIESGSLPMELCFYTHPDDPPYFSDIQPAGHIPTDPASQACVNTVKEWIKGCDDLHPHCLPRRNVSTTPTRLISVGLSSNDIKLCRSDEVSANAHYVALSHTWGKKEERRKAMPLLLTGNVSTRMRGIPWDELTKTFQDAVTITRNIGVPYVWIDSLCIVQDNHEDWAKEAARMASVYKYAYLVIAATSSKNGDDGCLRLRDPSHDLTGPGNGSFHVQRQIYHRTIVEWQAESTAMPLLDRAWCFQERLLASRTLHYTKSEMIWECQEQLWCECQLVQFDDPPARSKFDNPRTMTLDTFKLSYAAAVASTDPNVRARSWDKFVERYSELALTFGTDRLPGISGIAREVALPSLGTYLAGLWEYQLPQALLWASTGRVIDRSSQYLAPTWSWASIVTAVVPYETPSKITIDSVCRVFEITYTPNTDDIYGHVREGRLRISGPTITATLKRTDRKWTSRPDDFILEIPNTEAPQKLGVVTMTSDIELMEDTVTVVILFIHVRPCYTMATLAEGLALIQSKTHTGCWERIGTVRRWGLDLSQIRESEFIIV